MRAVRTTHMSAPTLPVDDPSPEARFPEFLQSLMIHCGCSQSEVARAMEAVVRQYIDRQPEEKREHVGNQLHPVRESTISRWRKAPLRKPVKRSKFNAFVLTALDLRWETRGRPGRRPGLEDVDKLWMSWTTGRPIEEQYEQSQERNTTRLPQATAEPAVEIDPADQEKGQVYGAYGLAGAELLDAARSGDSQAALELGLLRTLDQHIAEGEHWLRQALDAQNVHAGELLSRTDLRERRSAAAATAFICAGLPGADAHPKPTRVLLLEGAAGAGHRKAAALLADHFGRTGDTGSAERWRRLADRGE
jgi:hypothetical protein